MSGQHGLGAMPPLSAIHPDDHAGHLWIVTILSTIYVSISAIVRGHIKWGVYGADDYLLAAATLVYFGQSGAIFHGLNYGLAKFNSITSTHDWETAGKSFLAAEILAIFTLCLAKCSVVCLMHRVFTSHSGWKLVLSLVSLLLSVAWGIAGIATISANCNPTAILTTRNQDVCPGQTNKWRIFTIIDIFTDAFICLSPIALTWHLQMARKAKVQVILAFALRLPVVVLSALHFDSLAKYPSSDEPLFAVTNALLYQQAMILWSLISATIPNMKAFVKSFSTDFGLAMGLGTQSSKDYALQHLTIGSARTRKSKKANSAMRDDEDSRPFNDAEGLSSSLRPDAHGHKTTVVGAIEDGNSIGSHGSQDLIIRKEVKWHVRSESTERVDGVV